MKGLSALCLLGIVNAIYWGIKNQWMFEPSTKRGGNWWIADALVGLACFIIGPALWRAAEVRSYRRLYVQQAQRDGTASADELERAWRDHIRDFQ